MNGRRSFAWNDTWTGSAGPPLPELACLLLFGLAAAVQSWPGFRHSLALQAVVLLTPALSMIALTLWAEHQFAVAMQYVDGGIRSGYREVGGAMLRRVGWITLPILLVMAVVDVATAMAAGTRHLAAQRGWFPATGWPASLAGWFDGWPILPTELIVGVGLVLLVPLLVPLITMRFWATQPLDQPQHQWLRALVSVAGLPRLEIRIWDTGMCHANAVVVGLVPPMRVLLISDRLLRDYPAEQLRLIVLHELAHIKRWHIAFRIVAILPGWGAAGLLVHTLGGGTTAMLLGHAVGIVATLILLRFAAHVTEHDADRQACVWGMQLPSPMPTTAREQAMLLCRALMRVVGGGAAAGQATWLHPSVDDRCLELLAWAESIDGADRIPYFNSPDGSANLLTHAQSGVLSARTNPSESIE